MKKKMRWVGLIYFSSARSGHREYIRQMNQMFGDPFGFRSGGLLGIEGPRQVRTLSPQQQQQQLAPTDLFGFGSMFQNMRRMMDDMNSTFVSTTSTSFHGYKYYYVQTFTIVHQQRLESHGERKSASYVWLMNYDDECCCY